MGAATAAEAVAITLASWELDMSSDRAEVTSFGDLNKQYVQGLKDIKGTLSGFWDSASDALYDAMGSTNGVKMYLYPSSAAPTKYWYGYAFTDFKITTPVGGPVEISGGFGAAGDWGQY
ncbi:MAG TPA: hypothetical protein PK406_00610 [Verrucomicrobiota bacterium]|nr:hypothetical protein [Verrucomicrobiota bacterium]